MQVPQDYSDFQERASFYKSGNNNESVNEANETSEVQFVSKKCKMKERKLMKAAQIRRHYSHVNLSSWSTHELMSRIPYPSIPRIPSRYTLNVFK